MAEITRKRTGEFLLTIFKQLNQRPDGMPARDALKLVADTMILTPYESGVFDSGGKRFEIIIRFATIDCVKSGWMYKQKRSWYITDEGKQAYQLYSNDPEGFYKEATRLYNLWKSNQPQAETSEEPITDGQEEIKQVSITYENAEEQAWKDIKNHIHHMHPYEFQQMVAGLLRAMGYYVSWVAPPGRDGGIDIMAQGDPIGALPLRIKVQVKRQQSAIGVDGLRSFMAVLNDNDIGIFVSLGGFTKDAADEARYQEKRKITLIDLELLFDLWVQYYDKLTNEARLHMLLKPIHFLDPGED
jgi:restriction system protein